MGLMNSKLGKMAKKQSKLKFVPFPVLEKDPEIKEPFKHGCFYLDPIYLDPETEKVFGHVNRPLLDGCIEETTIE